MEYQEPYLEVEKLSGNLKMYSAKLTWRSVFVIICLFACGMQRQNANAANPATCLFNGSGITMTILCSKSNGGYAKLRDWPAAQGLLRKPQYLLGPNNYILFTVSYKGEMNDNNFRVIVTSESSGDNYAEIPLNGSNGVYTNIDHKLYVGRTTQRNYMIGVTNEEVLTFKLKLGGELVIKPPVTIMVDRLEAGFESQDYYGGIQDYIYSSDMMEGIGDYINVAGIIWDVVFRQKDSASCTGHWSSDTDSGWADAVDLAFWAGHGAGHIMGFYNYNTHSIDQLLGPIYGSRICWGDTDAEWIILGICSFLHPDLALNKQLMGGAHLVCGFASGMDADNAKGTAFSSRLGSMSIKDAWLLGSYHSQKPGTTARVVGAVACVDETFQQGSPVYIKRDPNSSSLYNHWDRTVPIQ